jgi:deoxyhypusine synthase
MTIEELVEVFASSGYNGRQLGEAAKLYAKMIKEDVTIAFPILALYVITNQKSRKQKGCIKN